MGAMGKSQSGERAMGFAALYPSYEVYGVAVAMALAVS